MREQGLLPPCTTALALAANTARYLKLYANTLDTLAKSSTVTASTSPFADERQRLRTEIDALIIRNGRLKLECIKYSRLIDMYASGPQLAKLHAHMIKLISNLNHRHSQLNQSLNAYSTASDFNRILDVYTAVMADIEKIKAEITELQG